MFLINRSCFQNKDTAIPSISQTDYFYGFIENFYIFAQLLNTMLYDFATTSIHHSARPPQALC